MSPPGEVWRYDTSMTLLGALMEGAAKQSLHDALRERIFEPLGMKDTGFNVPADKLHRLPGAYQRNTTTRRARPLGSHGPAELLREDAGLCGCAWRARVDGRRLPRVREHAARQGPHG